MVDHQLLKACLQIKFYSLSGTVLLAFVWILRIVKGVEPNNLDHPSVLVLFFISFHLKTK